MRDTMTIPEVNEILKEYPPSPETQRFIKAMYPGIEMRSTGDFFGEWLRPKIFEMKEKGKIEMQEEFQYGGEKMEYILTIRKVK